MNPEFVFTFPIAIFLSVCSAAGCSVGAVNVWSKQRRKERESYYRSEVLKKLADSEQMGATVALEFLQREQENWKQRVREGTKLGGLIALATGVALILVLTTTIPDRPAYLSGLVPMLIGATLLIYSYFLAPKS